MEGGFDAVVFCTLILFFQNIFLFIVVLTKFHINYHDKYFEQYPVGFIRSF